MTESNRYLRIIAGTIELFVGAYFATFGSLATVYFSHAHYPRRSLVAAAVSLFGVLLIFRAARLLSWKRWFFLFVAIPMLLAPLIWYLPPLFGYEVPWGGPAAAVRRVRSFIPW